MPKATLDPGPISFKATIEQPADGPGAFIVFPHDLKELYGIGNLVPVVATFDDVEYRGSIAKMGGPPILIVRKDVREQIGKQAGDTIDVTVALDTQPRELKVPDDLAAALNADADARRKFDDMSYSHRREYVRWIDEAKREETRGRRVQQAVEMIRAGKRRM
jgi:hypothetical protein